MYNFAVHTFQDINTGVEEKFHYSTYLSKITKTVEQIKKGTFKLRISNYLVDIHSLSSWPIEWNFKPDVTASRCARIWLSRVSIKRPLVVSFFPFLFTDYPYEWTVHILPDTLTLFALTFAEMTFAQGRAEAGSRTFAKKMQILEWNIYSALQMLVGNIADIGRRGWEGGRSE